MKLRWVYPILLLSSLLIAGCVRQAGQPFEPAAPSGNINTPLPPTDLPTQEPVDEVVTAEAQSAETEISITVIPPTETPLPLLETTNTPTATTLPATATVPASETPITDVGATIGAQSADGTEEAVDDGNQSVVPSFPQVPDIITETPVPTATTAPAIAATPTDFANLDGIENEDGTPSASVDDECVYVVQRGDNPFRIAVNNNVTLAELQRANPSIVGINPVIQPGQKLDIPGCGDGTAVDEPEDDATPEAGATTSSGGNTPPRATATIAAPDGYFAYSIASGDTLFELGQEYGTTVAEIVRFNDIPNPDSLAIGDVIFLPLEDE